MRLHGYYRSSAAYRVRIALHWKELPFESASVDLRAGEQGAATYRKLNPQGLVPCLVDGPIVLAQSLAILEYLEETRPDPPLLPADAAGRARVRQLALIVACDVHPLQNLWVLQYLDSQLGAGEAARRAWLHHWIGSGLGALEALAADHPATGRFCHGDAPSLADVCLVPQLYSARRHELSLEPYPTLRRIEAACLALPAFARAAPEAQ